MSTREVPREEWVSFCDSFSRQHEGWRVTVEVLGAGLMYVLDPSMPSQAASRSRKRVRAWRAACSPTLIMRSTAAAPGM